MIIETTITSISSFEIVIISIAAFFIAILTFFSGFGLGTLLTPVFMIFFPVDLAIALTGVVHFFNNVFKLVLVGNKADKQILLRFGIPAVLFAIIGAWLLLRLTDLDPVFSYELGSRTIEIYPLKLMISFLLIVFALIDLLPQLNSISFNKKHLPVGGALSGFFGGLSGNQGALRSAFLIRSGLTKEVYIGTSVVISCFVDFTRLAVYSSRFAESGLSGNIPLVVSATIAGILGAFLGNRLLKKVTLKTVQVIVAGLLIIVGLGLGLGLL